jgi:hypothetical protein
VLHRILARNSMPDSAPPIAFGQLGRSASTNAQPRGRAVGNTNAHLARGFELYLRKLLFRDELFELKLKQPLEVEVGLMPF